MLARPRQERPLRVARPLRPGADRYGLPPRLALQGAEDCAVRYAEVLGEYGDESPVHDEVSRGVVGMLALTFLQVYAGDAQGIPPWARPRGAPTSPGHLCIVYVFYHPQIQGTIFPRSACDAGHMKSQNPMVLVEAHIWPMPTFLPVTPVTRRVLCVVSLDDILYV